MYPIKFINNKWITQYILTKFIMNIMGAKGYSVHKQWLISNQDSLLAFY